MSQLVLGLLITFSILMGVSTLLFRFNSKALHLMKPPIAQIDSLINNKSDNCVQDFDREFCRYHFYDDTLWKETKILLKKGPPKIALRSMAFKTDPNYKHLDPTISLRNRQSITISIEKPKGILRPKKWSTKVVNYSLNLFTPKGPSTIYKNSNFNACTIYAQGKLEFQNCEFKNTHIYSHTNHPSIKFSNSKGAVKIVSLRSDTTAIVRGAFVNIDSTSRLTGILKTDGPIINKGSFSGSIQALSIYFSSKGTTYINRIAEGRYLGIIRDIEMGKRFVSFE